MEKILGLDLGTNSIGWAIVEKDDSTELVDKGILIFQEGVKLEKGAESSKAAERTSHRALRVHYFRRRLRKVKTLTILSDLGFCPTLSADMLNGWMKNGKYPLTDDFMIWQRTDDSKDKNPYACRFEAVDRKLNLNKLEDRYILGRALYHIAQRRGFLSNRLDTTDEKEDGLVKGNISELNKKISDSGCRTLGEFFYRCYGNEKIRTNYTSRLDHYKAEFDEICKVQELPEDVIKRLEKPIFLQRPLRSQKGLVGKCTFEKDKARCPVSHPRYEHYRMLCFVNNIRIQGVTDSQFRPLNEQEKEMIKPLFLRKSKVTFDFKEIANKIAGKNNYQYFKNPEGKPYQFNFRMDTTVSGSPFTAQMVDIFGESWEDQIANLYTATAGKSRDQIVNDIWHVLFSFSSDEKLTEFAKTKLGLDDEMAIKFTKVKTPRDYASLSLNAINKIIPYLEQSMIYSHAVFLANMGSVLPKEVWNNEINRKMIIKAVIEEVDNYDNKSERTLQKNILDFLRDNFELKPFAEKLLYHPSMIETYPDSQNGLLGSPRTNAIKNPMAMRTMFQLRQLINKLLVEGKIDTNTKINVEMVRELNNANMRKAIEQWQRDLEKQNKEYADAIRAEVNIEPTEDDILKYRLWVEQGEVCLYTGKKIRVSDFIGEHPLYDIEHTVPRSRDRDNSQMNKTLADLKYNREIKRYRIPSELNDFEAIKVRIEIWEIKIDDLEKQIEANKRRRSFATKEEKDKHITRRNRLIIERDYWRGKYKRMVAEDLTKGFSNSQGVDAGIISKYAYMYLKSLFPRVYTVKGAMTAEFRKLWGLQSDYQKKERVNHIHHCIDAITIACIGKRDYDMMSHYYRRYESYQWGCAERPSFEKPWDTFTEDVKAIEESLLVSHYTTDNLGKNSRKKVRVRGKVVEGLYHQGDTARASLHLETYYGAIMKDDNLKYVLRKSLDQLSEKDVDKIVDEVVKEKVKEAIELHGLKAIQDLENCPVWMNEDKGVQIKKVRCFTHVTKPLHIRKHRDLSRHEYKQQFHVVNDGNYMIAIYEGVDAKGKKRRDFELLNNMTAVSMLKRSADKVSFSEVIPSSKGDLPLLCTLKTGTMVIFWENSPEEVWELEKKEQVKRLYKVTIMSSNGQMTFMFHQEARPKSELKEKDGKFLQNEPHRPLIRMYSTAFNALVEGYDFELDVTGEIKPIKK